MKTTNNIIIAFLFFISTVSAQNELKFGRQGSDCRGSGICSFSEVKDKSLGNATVLYQGSSILLRIFRSKITEEEEYKLLGEKITSENSKTLNIFTVETTLVLEEDKLSKENNEQTNLRSKPTLQRIEAGVYPLKIDKEHIDILIKQ